MTLINHAIVIYNELTHKVMIFNENPNLQAVKLKKSNTTLWRGRLGHCPAFCVSGPVPHDQAQNMVTCDSTVNNNNHGSSSAGLRTLSWAPGLHSSPFHFPTPAISPAWLTCYRFGHFTGILTSLPGPCRNLIAYLRSKMIPRSAITC